MSPEERAELEDSRQALADVAYQIHIISSSLLRVKRNSWSGGGLDREVAALRVELGRLEALNELDYTV